MRKPGLQLLFAVGFGCAITLVSWLMISPDSSLHSPSSVASELFSGLQIVATFLVIVLSGNAHGGASGEKIYWVLVFAQWLLVGFGLSALLRLRRSP
jgi:hypothetical protein